MRRTLVTLLLLLVPVGGAIAGVQALRLWLQPRDLGLPRRVAHVAAYDWGPDFRKAATRQVNTGTLTTGKGVPSDDPGGWEQFRRGDRSNVAPPQEKLLRTWPAGGPKPLWRLKVGPGHAGPVVHAGRVYLIDYDAQKFEDVVRCLSLADGEEIWRYSYSVHVKEQHGSSRTVPAVTDDVVVTLGPKAHVVCLQATTGELLWKRDLVQEYGTVVPPWYAGQCPLIDQGRVILAPGARPLMMAVEPSTGRTLWETPNPGGWGMTHSSIVAMDYRGEREYIYCTTRGVVGVRASDGVLLWKTEGWRVKIANIATPVVVDESRVFFSGGYDSGAAMFRLTGEGTSTRCEPEFRLDAEVFGSPQQTPILYQSHIYGIIPNGELACLDLGGERLWTSGSTRRFGLGPLLLADGMLLVLNDQTGVLHLIEATPTGYKETAQAKVVDGHDAWGPMALVSGKLLLRSYDELVCVKVGERK